MGCNFGIEIKLWTHFENEILLTVLMSLVSLSD